MTPQGMPQELAAILKRRESDEITHEHVFRETTDWLWEKRDNIRLRSLNLKASETSQDAHWREELAKRVDRANEQLLRELWAIRVYFSRIRDNGRWADWGGVTMKLFGVDGMQKMSGWDQLHHEKKCVPSQCTHCDQASW